MNTESQNKLINDFPTLYGLKETTSIFGKTPVATTFSLYGFECGDGWEPIIRKLSEKLDSFNKYLTPEEKPVQAVQVKEKLGTLRFYIENIQYNTAWEEVHKLIHEAEVESATTCELCGNKGALVQNHWLRVRCEEHKDDTIGNR